ncbi:MAG TPA: cytochrome P450 [Candidatus Binataceae bacterium]|nr:cytochrome P450 [Candidatus Binataceae bacterium]
MTQVTADQLTMREVIADPYSAYRQLREQSPFNYIFVPAGSRPGLEEPIKAWAFLKFNDVYGALRDHETFSSARPAKWAQIFPGLVLIEDDPPRHTRFRRLVNKAFTVRRIEALTPWITAVANELIDHLHAGENDIVPAYAVPLPVKVIARLLGIPGEDYETFKRWSDAFLSTVPTDQAANLQNVSAMISYFGKTAAARRAHGAEDLITALVEAEVEGEKLDEAEILGFCILLLIAGNETTTNLIGNMLNALAERPVLWEQLRGDRSLVEQVIDESLRYESPVQRLSRYATRDVEVSGVRIPAGDIVRIYYGAANRDPKAFNDPDEFRLDRDLRNHVGFGMGIHYCLGAPLARAEAKITLNALLDRFAGIRRGPSPALRQIASPVIFGFKHLPLVLER